MTTNDRSEEVLSFGSFELMPARRILLENGKPVGIRSRALDILCLLVEAAGQIMSKDELLARAWRSTFVAEANVRVQINELRRALGDGRHGRRYIVTVPNRGYSFVETVLRRPAIRGADPSSGTDWAGPDSPPWAGRIIGRDRSIQTLAKQIQQRRLVTVVGTGGVGKTTLVLSVIAQMRQEAEKSARQKIVFIDLASLSDGHAVPSAFASALGAVLAGEDALSSIVNYLGEEKCLLVIDNCEHVINPVVDIVEAILRHAPNVFLLATSREPLRVADEWVYRLQPLATPPAAATLSLDEALAYPAAALFVERVCARCGSMVLRDDDGRFVAEICRRLDGIPLALELAAGRYEAFGARGLAAVLDNLFAVLTRGERRALPRQQTLHATLDWSFNLLTTRDQTLLRRLAAFSNRFTLDSASAIAAWGELSTADVTEGVADLVSQSLISTVPAEEEPCFILLETTRAYAREKLVAAPCAAETARRHARWCLDLLAEIERPAGPARAIDELGLLADLRAALNWAFSPRGDPESGVALTVAAIPLWLRLSLVSECRQRVEEALARHGDEDDAGDGIVLKLQTARGWSLMYNAGTARETSDVWKVAHGLAERLDDNDYRLRSLWGIWAGHMKSAAFEAALDSAFQFKGAAEQSPDRDDLAIADRLIGTSLHFLGDQPGARHHIEQMLDRYPAPGLSSHIARYQVAPRIAALMTLSRVLWLQGHAGAAADMAAASIAEARSLSHHLSLCYTLAQSACPIALLNGDFEQAERLIDELVEETTRHRLEVWHIYAQAYRGHLQLLQGEPERGLPLMQRAVDELRSARFMQHHSAFALALVEALISADRPDVADALLDEQLAYLRRGNRLWVAPEILRLKGELALRLGDQNSGEALLDQSLMMAKQTGQLGWHIRSCLKSSASRSDRLRAIQKIVPRSLLGHFDLDMPTRNGACDLTPLRAATTPATGSRKNTTGSK